MTQELFECLRCNNHFESREEIKNHLVNHHNDQSDLAINELNRSQYTKCNQPNCTQFLRDSDFIHHLKVDHQLDTTNKNYYCKFCNKFSNRHSSYRSHLNTVECTLNRGEEVVFFNCTKCNKRFAGNRKSDHIRVHHRGEGNTSFIVRSN